MSYPPGPQVPYGQQPYQAPVPSPPTSSKATLSLVLGIVSLFCLGLLTGIPAIWIGISARREIRKANAAVAGPDGYTGEGGYTPAMGKPAAMSGDGLALGGIIAGVLGTLWSVVAIALLVGLIAFGADVANDYQDACDQLQNGQTPDKTVLGEPIGPEDCVDQ
jgi:hypothetical protein